MGRIVDVDAEGFKEVPVEMTWSEKALEKGKEFGTKVVDTAKACVDWCAENKEAALGIGLTIGELFWFFGVEASKMKRRADERYEKSNILYDPHTGFKYELKKPMYKWTFSQQKAFNDQIEAGMSYFEALNSREVNQLRKRW